jgi:hypothetical protein
MFDGYLLVMNFPRGSVRLTKEFVVEVEGPLYPRELAASSHMIQVMKEQAKEESSEQRIKAKIQKETV